MKKFALLFLTLISISTLQAQDITDALRYGSEELSGSARFTAMSGAFGALGGDFSAIKVNPAGSAVFLSDAATISLNVKNSNNDARLQNGNNPSFTNGFLNNSESDFSLNQAGVVFVFHETSGNSPFQKFTLGLTYDQVANFDDQIFVAGKNATSIGNYFLERANGVPLDLFTRQGNENIADLYAYLGTTNFSGGYNNQDLQEAYLGYETYIIEAVSGDFDNTAYTSNIAGNEFDQQYRQISTGLNGKLTVNVGAQFMDDLYMGININSHFINYERTTIFHEENDNAGSEINQVHYENSLSTLGSGISFQVGAIYKIGNMVRLGASYTSPTWYTISEETAQYLRTDSNEFGPATADPRVINIFPEYRLRTPGKLTGSLAVVFGKSGLLSFDYSYKDYSNTEFGSEFGDHVFAPQNTAIENNLQAASTYNIGGEYRIANWSLRGGYHLEESPYKNEDLMGQLTGYSFGFGYDFGNIELDFAYARSQRDYHQRMYQTGLVEKAIVENKNSNYTASISFGF